MAEVNSIVNMSLIIPGNSSFGCKASHILLLSCFNFFL